LISWAQNFEDVILWRIFKDLKEGFYVDLGAGHPEIDSVSNWFYQNSWTGIDVEPSDNYFVLLQAARPKNTVIKRLVGNSKERSHFFDVKESGLSSSNASQIETLQKQRLDGELYELDVISLDDVLVLKEQGDIHWLKIDIEGSEFDAIQSWKQSTVRPWIILIESTVPNSQIESYADWEPLLLLKGYEFVYFDGLNRFYVHERHRDLAKHFKSPPNYFDFFELSGKATNAFAYGLTRELSSTQAELSSTQAEKEVVISRFVESKSWRVTKYPRELYFILMDKRLRNTDFLVWKVRSKLAFEKKRICRLFHVHRNLSHQSQSIVSEEKRTVGLASSWVDPELVKLTKLRLTKR